jgi:hypothetical protein
MPMSPRLLRPILSGDPDALRYIAAVQAADQQSLELPVRKAITDFIVGCKADGIWDAIKASCILMGARTLSGALVPLKGPAPDNVGPFVGADYARKTGITGKTGAHLNTNRNRQDDPQDSCHAAIYVTAPHPSGSGFQRIFGCGEAATGRSRIVRNANDTEALFSHGRNVDTVVNTGGVNNFVGLNRASSASYDYLINSTIGTVADASQARTSNTWHVFNNNPTSIVFTGRIAFYSVGEGLSLSNLDTRVAALFAAIGNAI